MGFGVNYDITSDLLYSRHNSAGVAFYWAFRALEYGMARFGDGRNGFPSGTLSVSATFSW